MAITFRIRALREARGWTQSDLAERADVRQATLSELERGKNVRAIQTLAQLAKTLGVSIGELFVDSDAPKSKRRDPRR